MLEVEHSLTQPTLFFRFMWTMTCRLASNLTVTSHSYVYLKCVIYDHILDVLVIFVQDVSSIIACMFETYFTYFHVSYVFIILVMSNRKYTTVRQNHVFIVMVKYLKLYYMRVWLVVNFLMFYVIKVIVVYTNDNLTESEVWTYVVYIYIYTFLCS